MSTETVCDTDLEEMFNLDIPCGGNNYPIEHDCPHQAAAAMASTHTCSSNRARGYKCLD